MNREDILASARMDKSKGKEFEENQSIRGMLLGLLAAIVVGIVLFLLEYCVKKTINWSLIVLVMSIAGVQCLFEGIKTRKVCMAILGGLQLFAALVTFLYFVSELVIK